MLKTFGWKVAIAVVINALRAAIAFRSYLRELPATSPELARLDVPGWIVIVHLAFLASVSVVVFSHHAVVFIACFSSSSDLLKHTSAIRMISCFAKD